jgi:hypothetical protein
LILLAFLLPFSIYLLLLGILNRRPHPVVIPGTWDFAGILFAAAGFLLVGGPAIISSSSESWRMFWLFGPRGGAPAIDESAVRLWPILASLYFAIILGGAILLLYRRRGLTAIYNVESESFEKAMARVLGSLGVNPIRSGNLFVFGAGSTLSASPQSSASAIQPPHHFPAILESPASAATTSTSDARLIGEPAVLEMDPFPLLRHVTLRWDPANTMLRREIETELARALSGTPTRTNPAGDWMILIAMALIGFNLLVTFGLTMTNLASR